MNHGTQNKTRRDGGPTQLADHQRHALLAVERRRTALDALVDADEPMDLHDLAVTVAARETGVADVDDETVQRVALSLHHAHLPKMEELGVVGYDAGSTRIWTQS